MNDEQNETAIEFLHGDEESAGSIEKNLSVQSKSRNEQNWTQ